MKLNHFSVLAALVLLLGACVPNKRIVYLQGPNEPKRGTVANSDTVARIYQTHFSEYKLKPRDIITVRVASITPSDYDFIQKYEEQLGLIRKLNQYDQSNQAGAGQRMRSSGGGGGGTNANGMDPVMQPITLDRQQTGFILDDSCHLELPYIGTIDLKNVSITDAEAIIKKKLKGYFETPVVRIQLLSFHFTILGEVNSEGRYTIFNPNATIIDAFTLAGNLNDFADRSKIKIVRFEGSDAKVFYVNTLKEDLLGQPGFFLQPNDLVIVPPLQARASRKYTLPTYTTTISLVTSTLAFILFLIGLNKD